MKNYIINLLINESNRLAKHFDKLSLLWQIDKWHCRNKYFLKTGAAWWTLALLWGTDNSICQSVFGNAIATNHFIVIYFGNAIAKNQFVTFFFPLFRQCHCHKSICQFFFSFYFETTIFFLEMICTQHFYKKS